MADWQEFHTIPTIEKRIEMFKTDRVLLDGGGYKVAGTGEEVWGPVVARWMNNRWEVDGVATETGYEFPKRWAVP
ncbi:MAG: hypothetical protein ACRC14_15180 [Paracoccaceae bacterium]